MLSCHRRGGALHFPTKELSLQRNLIGRQGSSGTGLRHHLDEVDVSGEVCPPEALPCQAGEQRRCHTQHHGQPEGRPPCQLQAAEGLTIQ